MINTVTYQTDHNESKPEIVLFNGRSWVANHWCNPHVYDLEHVLDFEQRQYLQKIVINTSGYLLSAISDIRKKMVSLTVARGRVFSLFCCRLWIKVTICNNSEVSLLVFQVPLPCWIEEQKIHSPLSIDDLEYKHILDLELQRHL